METHISMPKWRKNGVEISQAKQFQLIIKRHHRVNPVVFFYIRCRKEGPMSVFRVEKNKNYTVMSNYHLRDKSLSLKAKGLLSQILSLPEDWDYTLKGLSKINREGIDAIRQAVRELEGAGYIIRSRERDRSGCLQGTEYIIYEQPQRSKPPILGNPMLEHPVQENPIQ